MNKQLLFSMDQEQTSQQTQEFEEAQTRKPLIDPKLLSRQIIQHLSKKQWNKVNKKSCVLFQNQFKFIPQFNALAQHLATTWIQNQKQQLLLQYFDFLLLKVQSKKDRDQFKNKILQITYHILKLIRQEADMGDLQEVQTIWLKFIQILRSFTFRSLDWGLDQTNWFFYSVIISLLLKNSVFKNSQDVKLDIYRGKQIIYSLTEMKKNSYILKFCTQNFHEICLFLRTFIADVNQFMNKDSIFFKQNLQYPSINHCSLITKLILNEMTLNQQINDKIPELERFHKRLDCLMLLITCIQIQQPKSQNSSNLYQICMGIILCIQQEELSFNKSNFTFLQFYCGQLLSLMCYKNIQWVMKNCRQQQTTKQMIKIYKTAIKYVMKNHQSLQDENINSKRLALGFCGVLRVNSMETQIELMLTSTFPSVIKLIEKLYGYLPEEKQKNQNQEERYKKKKKIMKGKEKQDKQQIYWSEAYYEKHKIQSFDEIDQIEVLKESFRSMKANNAQMLAALMENFDENSAIMWLLELQNKQDDESI